MKKLFSALLLIASSLAFSATLTPIQLLNPAGSTSGKSLTSTGPTTAPAWAAVGLTTGVSGVLPVANGGTGAATLTGLALGSGTSAFSAYAGTTCTNQFTRSLSAAGVATCATVGSSDLAASLSLTTPTLGVATATSINKIGFTAPTTAATFAFGTDNATITLQGTDTYIGRATADTLTNKTFDTAGTGNVFKINGVMISSNTGTGSNVLATSPTLVTPSIGVATASSINGNAITTSTGTLTLGTGKTLTASNTLTFTGTDSSSVNFGAGGTVLYASAPGSFTTITHTQQEIDTSYTYNQPTTGQTVTIASGTQTAIIDPAGTLAALTVTLPACNSGYNGSIVRFSSSQAVTVLTVNATSGSVVGGPTSLALGSGSGYLCRGSSTTWHRLY